MSKKIIATFLSALLLISSFGFVSAEKAELTATDWTQKILSVKGNNLANETLNYSEISDRWDPQTEFHYRHIVSCNSTSEDNLTAAGGASTLFYIGNWSIGTIPVSELGGEFYVAVLARTDSASKPNYRPLNVNGGSAPAATAATAFRADGNWEFNYIDFSYATPPTSFTHGQFRFNTEAGKYIDLAAWGLFASSVSKENARAALESASKVSESNVVTTSIADRNGNIVDAHIIGKVTLPILEDSTDEMFSGWTTTKDGTTVVAQGGTEYTATESVILYPVYTAKVRFVNGFAETNGDGLTPETAYNKFANAATDLKDIGGTIVITGETATFAKLNNTKDIVITSVFNGVDYRDSGAKFNFTSANNIVLGYVDNPGKVTFENINITDTAADGWHLYGHSFEVKDSVNVLTSSGSSAKVQIMAVCSNNESNPPKAITKPFSVTVNNTNMSSIILGARIPITISDVDITVNGKLSEIAVSNNTYNRYWSENDSKVDVGFGKLTVDGDIKVTVNGTLSDIFTRTAYASQTDYYPSLDKITGNIAVIVNHGGTFKNNIADTVCERTNGKWLKITGIEGTTISYGENADDIVLKLDSGLDYNFVTVSNGTTEKEYTFFIENDTSEFTLPESGNYTMTLSKNESKTVTFIDADGGNTVDAVNAFSGFDITLPTLSDTDILCFNGWTDEQNGKTAKYYGGDSFTVNADITLYAVWTEAETYKITFKNGDTEFASFIGVKGATIIYPDTYPIKDGFYFTGWDKTPEKLGEEDITVNATFKAASEVGAIYYWNGEAASDGDGTYAKPFKLLSTLVKKLNETGGTVIVLGKCDIIYQPMLKSTEDVIFTALDPLTGHNFGGEFDSSVVYNGGHLYMPQGVYWGGAAYQTGAIIFENIDILNVNGQYGIGHLTFDGHEYVIGENVRHLSPETGKAINWFLGGTSSNNSAKPHVVKGVFKSPVEGTHWLARGGGVYDIDTVDYTYYAKTDSNIAQDSADVVTITGAMKFTFFAGSEGSKLYHSRASYAFDDKAYASIILNDDVTIQNQLKTNSEGLNGRVYTVKASEGVSVTHTDKKGVYAIESDSYNYAEILDSDGKVIDEAIISEGTALTVSAYGEYTVRASNKTLYGIDYITSPYDSVCPDSFRVTSEETDKHTIVLPELSTQNAHSFEGWTTVNGGTVAEYSGNEEITLSSVLTLYAVWKTIPTFTVTFKDDSGNVLYQHTGYAGAPMKFPENNPFKYGQKLLGYAYEGTTDIISADATVPEENRTALPVWGEIPAGETRIYVNGDSGNNQNNGISPDTALKTIEAAVALLKDSGGYIIVTGGSNVLSKHWNNSCDITLTSLDPISGTDYRAKISDDGLSLNDGAYITYAYAPFGFNVITGKITINNVVLLNTTNNEFLCFNGHPFEIGKGIYSYQKKSTDAKISTTNLNVRALGEGDSSKTNPEGIVFTINELSAGSLRVFAIGKASNTVPGIDITVDSDFSGNLIAANDSLGGVSTVNGDIKLTINGKLKNSIGFNAMTNPVKGNIYVACANGASVIVDNIRQEEGYGKYIVNAGEAVQLSHGENGSYIAKVSNDKEYSYATLTDEDGAILDVLSVADGTVSFTPEAFGSYTVEFTNTAMRKLTLETGTEDAEVTSAWYESGKEVEIPADIYRYGHIFMGWTDGTDIYTEGTITMPNKNITLTAIWEESPKYTITFDANGSDIATPSDISEYEGENTVLTKPQTSSVFVGWNEDKNAKTGVLNHVAAKDTTLYAITSDSDPVYVIDSHYRGDPDNYTGPRNSFRRYVVDVYLENATASSGSFKLNTDNMFLYYLGHIPQDGIEATVNAPAINTTYPGVPGLSYYRTPSIEFTWTSNTPIDTTNGRIKIARIMMYFSSWGMGYDKIANSTTDYVVSAYQGYKALAGDKEAYVTANFYKGIKSDEVKITGKVTLEGREDGTKPAYDSTKLFILDSAGDALEYIVLESSDSTKRTFTYSASVAPGEYTIRVIKNGYVSKYVPITVTDSAEIPEIVLFAGDTLDANGESDGIVDIDDFTRVLRGFAKDFPIDDYINAIDINEDGTVNVSDLAIVKSGLTTAISSPEFETSVDKKNLKLSDWKITVKNGKITIVGGSDAAAENAMAHIENSFLRNGVYRMPLSTTHSEDYDLYDITLDGVSISNYRIVVKENDATAMYYAEYIRDYIAEISGFGLEIVYDGEDAYEYEILVGATSRKDNPITAIEEYSVFEEENKFYVFYGDEQSAEMASLDLCEKILGKASEGYNGNGYVNVVKGASYNGRWSVLSRFGVMSDSHIGARYNWANYNWLYNTFDNFEKIHAENPLDFIVSLGDNIDDGYPNTYAADYAVYLEELKKLDICDAENPVEGRAEGKIPHYEISGNHDPVGTGIGGQALLRFIRNGLWYTENENGEKVAHIAFFTDYGGYPLHDYAYSGSYASYFSYGKVNDNMVKFVEESIIAANNAGAKHIILYNHWGMSQQVGSPMLPETGLGKIADVCEKYDIKLYFNGHEHDVPYTLRRYNEIYDYDVSMTSQKHAIVEITTLRAKVTIYNSADNSVFRVDTVPLSGRGEATQIFAK